MSFSLTYKHHYVVYSNRDQDSSNSLITDNAH